MSRMIPRSQVKDLNSKTQRLLANRTKDNITDAMKVRRDHYVEGLLLGLTKRAAAEYAGVPARTSSKEGTQLYSEPYVQERLRELREAMEEEQLLSRKELLLNVKSIAFNEDEQGSTRVSASTMLMKLLGYEKVAVKEAAVINNIVAGDTAFASKEALLAELEKRGLPTTIFGTG
jgi:hypothetical protein